MYHIVFRFNKMEDHGGAIYKREPSKRLFLKYYIWLTVNSLKKCGLVSKPPRFKAVRELIQSF